jgi:hypothetical protein
MDAVDEALKVLSESGRQMLFFHLEKSYSIKRHEIPEKPEAFAAGLKKIFGAGSLVLEKLIVKNLYSQLGLKFEDKRDYTIADFLNAQNMRNERKKTTNSGANLHLRNLHWNRAKEREKVS